MSSPASLPKSGARELFEQLIIAVVLALFVRTFVVQTFKIPSGSMENTLLVGDHLFVNKMLLSDQPMLRPVLPVGTIARGDVLVFKHPQIPDRDLIKRVIGLPGDTVEVRNKQLLVNGTVQSEAYTRYLFPPDAGGDGPTRRDPRWYFGPFRVPSDQYFMMGDNRDNSEDSRYWGTLPRTHVKGKALFLYWSAGDGGWPRMDRIFRQIR